MLQDVTLGLREWPLPHESWQMTHDAMAKLVSWFFHTYWEVTGRQPVGQNVELVPISNCKYSWVLSLSSTVLCVNLARENVKGNIFNLMIVGMGLIIWLVGQQCHTMHFLIFPLTMIYRKLDRQFEVKDLTDGFSALGVNKSQQGNCDLKKRVTCGC